jgi:HD-GYP domain-containing protein (c-di-GMP phosphodiesterase class II)
MRIIDMNDIAVGTVTEAEYRSQNGDLLISQGVTITDKHLEILRRRNIFQVYVKDSDEDEIHAILSKEYTLDEFHFDDEEPAKALDLPEFKNIKAGKDGLSQLMQSKKAAELDDTLSRGITPDKPAGLPLKQKAQEKNADERTVQYKSDVHQLYNDALKDVHYVLRTMADGHSVDGRQIRAIVERFVRLFITDKNILLNISGIKTTPDNFVYHHTLNVCLLAINIAASADYSEEQVVEIGMGALLHDLGMLLVPQHILTKEGKLDQDEWFEVQKHPILGLHLLESVTRLPVTVPYVAYQVHERENGKGYPKQRNGRLIHNFARIVQIADVYEALSSPRLYRTTYIPYKAMEMVIKMTRQGLLSGEYSRSFLIYASLFPVGSIVELSNKSIGKVVKANASSFAKPIVSVIVDEGGRRLRDDQIYLEDLKTSDLLIVKAHGFDYLSGFGVMDGF